MSGNEEASELIKRFSDEVSERISGSVELKMLQLEVRLNKTLSELVEKKVQEALGYNPADHREEHFNLRNMYRDYKDFTKTLRNRLITGMLAGALAMFGANSIQSGKIEAPPILSRDQSIGTEIRVDRAGEPKR